MKRIICVGNPFDRTDSAGYRVFARLAGKDLPRDVEVVDGGLRGIDLLALVQASERVAFVDSVSGFGQPGEVVTLEGDALLDTDAARCDHPGGFAYLLRALPYLFQPPVPVRLIGLEGSANERGCEEAAQRALSFVTSEAAWMSSGAETEA